MSDDRPRLIEVAFPLKQASLDSVHEKNVRHGHISTLHIWPARRPLAAARAALIATLLPDPGTDVERKRLLELLGGTVKTRNTFKDVGGRKVPVIKEETDGGILHWGRENGAALDFFRQEIKKAYGGRVPRVLDPFAGGGAIPLEAMRLGCEVTAIDINPVAWFILKCTLEYPQRLAGQTRPLPRFALESEEFMAAYWKARGNGRNGRAKKDAPAQLSMLEPEDADLSWHVRAWGHWVLERARRDLERFYPTVDGKPTVAYLWARTVTCKNCRATIPLLKTLWLCRKDNKRWRLELRPRADKSGVDFDVVEEPVRGGNSAQHRAHDEEIGRGTMSRAGAWCPVCGGPGTVAMTREDLQAEGRTGRLGQQMTAVVADGPQGKEYRNPVDVDQIANDEVEAALPKIFEAVPFGIPRERIWEDAKGSTWCVQYGLDTWDKVFSTRQMVALGAFVVHSRRVRDEMLLLDYPKDWVEAVSAYLICCIGRLADFSSTGVTWVPGGEFLGHTFVRFAIPVMWDFCEGNPLSNTSGNYLGALDWVARVCRHTCQASQAHFGDTPSPVVTLSSATARLHSSFDCVITDPPYYDAISYSNVMDFFYQWIRRASHGLSIEYDEAFAAPFGTKWDTAKMDGELVDDASRFDGDQARSKQAYEDGLARSFSACRDMLVHDGRLVVVFASKRPEAWEALAASIVRSGFVVDASWPIMTERAVRTRALSSAALASSVWIVSRKRTEAARPGWDTQVLEEMRSKIYDRLRDFWDAGIRGPDFVWAATGPALEAYSKHPVVKKADEPDSLMSVSEFLQHVRRIVVDYVVGRILSQNGPGDASALDDVTLYYLLHRHDFGLEEAPVGASILYAQSCNLRDRDLADRFDLLAYGKSRAVADEDEEGDEESENAEDEVATSGSTVKLKRWDQRRHKDLGLNAGGRSSPLIDQGHHIMHLWRGGDVQKVDAYLEDQGLRRNPVFPRLLQALVELARKDNQQDEVALLETVMNHLGARGAHPQMRMWTDAS
ncbi:MAG: DUF1156 domain-containing protein [Chloroflexi bacterium]|nr:DUF1156 domain-containing protein [Chloroflexota bacterium]